MPQLGQFSNCLDFDCLREYAKRAGITKRVYPYLLRHGRLTELAKDLSSAELKAHAGWRTDMSRVYVHLSGEDVGNKLLHLSNSRPKPQTNTSKTVQCTKCQHKNPLYAKFCNDCGLTLT